MITAPVIGIAPTPELTVAAPPQANATAADFAAIMQSAVPQPNVPIATEIAASAGQPAPTQGQAAEPTLAANVESLLTNPEPSGPRPENNGAALPVALDALLVQSRAVAALTVAPPQPLVGKIAQPLLIDDEPLDPDQPTDGAIETAAAQLPAFDRIVGNVLVTAPNPEKPAPTAPIVPLPPEGVVVVDAPGPKAVIAVDRVEIPAPIELRGLSITTATASEKSQPFVFERGATFAPQLMQIARDVLAVSPDRDVRFNVRPDVLGPVAVTIERTDAGSNLRLGVDSPAAVQAVRAAEPLLNDSRATAPFVQVTVDMTAPDERSRNLYRPVNLPQRGDDHDNQTIIGCAPVSTGRYA